MKKRTLLLRKSSITLVATGGILADGTRMIAMHSRRGYRVIAPPATTELGRKVRAHLKNAHQLEYEVQRRKRKKGSSRLIAALEKRLRESGMELFGRVGKAPTRRNGSK